MTFRTVATAFPLLLLVQAASASSSYLALGDSVAFGLHKDPNGRFGYNGFSNGDRGYVSVLADRLGQIDGARPTVANFSIPGETSTSFTDTSNLFRAANTNYGVPVESQEKEMEDYLGNSVAMGGVGTVSFAIGANDFLSLNGDLNLAPGAFADITARYSDVLTKVRAAAPNARLILPGYYNPYSPTSDAIRHAQAALVIGQLDTLIQGFAAQYNGRYVDFYDVIEGHQDTLLYPNDIHPNDAGYAALGRVAAQAVPEPGTWAALGLGAVAVLRRRRK